MSANRITNVVRQRISSAHGTCARREACWSANAAAPPATSAAGAAARISRTSVCVPGSSDGRRGSTSMRQIPGATSSAGVAPCAPASAPSREERSAGGRRSRTTLTGLDDARRPRCSSATAARCALASGGRVFASMPVNETPSAGSASATSTPPLARATVTGTSHHPACERRPATTRRRRLPPFGREGIDPRPEHVEERRKRHERDRPGGERDQRSADRHRPEEALREHEQRRHRRGDGQGREEHRPAGGRHRPPKRLDGVPADCELLPIARDHEQRVVDREPQPEPGDEVDREHREVGQLDERPQAEQRRGDRARARRAAAATRRRRP